MEEGWKTSHMNLVFSCFYQLKHLFVVVNDYIKKTVSKIMYHHLNALFIDICVT